MVVSKPRVRVPAGRGGMVAPSRPAPSAAYMNGGAHPAFQNWMPGLRGIDNDVKAAWRLGTARAVDAMQNSGWLTGAADQSSASVCGTGLTLALKPDMSFLGWNEDQTSEWARQVERRYELWANTPRACDITGRSTIGQLGIQAYRHWLGTGEIVGTLPWHRHEGSTFFTKVALKPAWQLSSRTDLLAGLNQGVRLNAVGAPVGYAFKVKTALQDDQEVIVRAFDAAGRPLAMHIFDGEPGQVRGITPFISILRVVRRFDQLSDATLTNAIVQAIFAAVVKSTGKPEDIIDALTSSSDQAPSDGNGEGAALDQLIANKADWYSKVDVNLGANGKIAHLFPGEELQFLRSENPNSTYEAFNRVLLREMSRPLAMTYEDLSGDWTGATYSSTRMSNAMIWPRVMYRRKNIIGRFHQISFEAWLEEDIENGGTPLPDGVEAFLANKDAICRADWRGPPKPQADDAKAAAAHNTYSEMGVMSDESICADLGTDVDDVYEQRAREKKRREKLGLPEPRNSNAAADAVARDEKPPGQQPKKDEAA